MGDPRTMSSKGIITHQGHISQVNANHHSVSQQSITRCQFQLSRRDRECLPFSLMLRDEIENFFPLVSCFETRSRISSLRSHASRRDREFLSSFSCFETRPRRMLKKMHFCWGMASLIFSPDIKDTRGFQQDFMKIQVCHPISLTGIWFGFGSMRPSTAWVVDEKFDFDQSEAVSHTMRHMLALFKILSLSISRFETRTRILSSKSRSSRRERDFFINISGFETRPRYFLSSLMFRDGTSRRD